ncbi:MAG: hypothetical protein O6952_09450, partial [Planctomycetota bacterium]|nr:hypothetical protein [Planctomycetota bacterium]
DKHLKVTVTLLDNLAGAVAGASVSADLELGGNPLTSFTGTTDTAGTVTFQYRGAPSGTYTTVITFGDPLDFSVIATDADAADTPILTASVTGGSLTETQAGVHDIPFHHDRHRLVSVT